MKTSLKFLFIIPAVAFILASCEGPQGSPGKDANENCIKCHNPEKVTAKVTEFEHSLHFTGEAFEEGTRSGCAPCHSHQGFTYVVKNNTPATFTLPASATKYVNDYDMGTTNAVLPGKMNCFTCHSSLHTTYTEDNFMPLTTTAAVPMTMYGGAKTINFAKTSSNLCAKCHQPRPITKSSDSNVIDYTVLVSNPNGTFNQASLSYRTGIHYGAQGAMVAGVGGIEFGTGYSNSAHTTNASCASCHMASPSFLSGGHSFSVYDEYGATISASSGGPKPYNFNGCNVSGCHTSMSYTSTTFTNVVADIQTKVDQLAAKINAIGAGHDLLQKDPTDNKYHGYLDFYDATSNPTGYWKNPNLGNVSFPTITNAQFGAIINFQLVVRGGGLGIHNYTYIKKLLENTLAAW